MKLALQNYFQHIPVYQDQIISQKGTLSLWPENMHKAAHFQIPIHMKGMSQLIHGLHKENTNKFHSELSNILYNCKCIFSFKNR